MHFSPTTRNQTERLARTMQPMSLFRLSIQMMRLCIVVLLVGFILLPQVNKETNMSSKPLSIRQAQQYSQKQFVKDWISRVIATAMPTRSIELFRQPVTQTNSFTDKAIMFHLRRRALVENRTGFMDRIHKSFWAGEPGAEFSNNCDHRFNDLFLKLQRDDFLALQKIWATLDGHAIVEIGTNSGLLLQHMTTNLANVCRAIGIDINPDQITRNQQSDTFDSRIEFLCDDGQDWIIKNAAPKSLFVTNGGVLEYFPREKLNVLMSHISTQCAPAVFYASEPVAHDHDFETNKISIPFGEEFSFSHNYKDLFESNGFSVLHQRSVIFESWKMQATIAVAKTKLHPEKQTT